MLTQYTHFASTRKLAGFGFPLVVALYAYSGTATAVEEVEVLPVDTQVCTADGTNCGEPIRDREQMRLCQENPESEECQRQLPPPPPCDAEDGNCEQPPLPPLCDPEDAACEPPPEVVERINFCQENPEAEECMYHIMITCDPAAEDCELPPEVAEKMAQCQENPDAEGCGRPEHAGNGKPPVAGEERPMADCVPPPEDAERMAQCQENPDAEGCGRPEQVGAPQPRMHHSNRCRVNPDFCNNPGPSTLDLENGVLELPAVRVPQANGEGIHYGARLRMSEDGTSFTLEEVTFLEDEEEATQE
jgi:hypothetical protein